jgi:arylsulfatase A-like enzyme
VSATSPTNPTGHQAPGPHPNVLVFLCDQLRIDLLRCYGGGPVRTPHIDALAADGVVFERAYTPTALCSPARASLMTGLYAHEHHMFNNSTPRYSYSQRLRPDLTTLADWIDEGGRYESAYFGKWHVGPAESLFGSRFHHTQRPQDGDWPFLGSSHWHPSLALGPLVRSVAGGKAGTLDVAPERFPDAVAAQYATSFLRHRDPARPFVLFCSFPGPHSPWLVPEAFGIRYTPDEVPIWPNRYDDFAGKPLNQRKLRRLEALRQPEAQGDAQLQALLACCFSYLELIDTLVGEVLATLKAQGLYERTAILFTADHGDMAGAHGFLSKGAYMYDEIYRIPLLLKPPAPGEGGTATAAEGPAPSGGRRVAAPVHLMDVTATLVHLLSGSDSAAPLLSGSNSPAPAQMGEQPLHGRSLLPLLRPDGVWERSLHYAQYHGDWYGHYSSRMVTDGRWKLVWNFSDLCELYDLQEDPHELRNRFYDPALASVRREYAEALLAEARRLGDGQVLIQSLAAEEGLPLDATSPLRSESGG